MKTKLEELIDYLKSKSVSLKGQIEKTGLYVLTSEVNDYNQYGQYFEKVYSKKPTTDELKKYLISENVENSTQLAISLLKNGNVRSLNNSTYHLLKVNEVLTFKQLENFLINIVGKDNSILQIKYGKLLKLTINNTKELIHFDGNELFEQSEEDLGKLLEILKNHY